MCGGYALADDVVVHRAQLLADAGLHFAAEAYLALALGRWPAHLVLDFRLVAASGAGGSMLTVLPLILLSCPRSPLFPWCTWRVPTLPLHQRAALAWFRASGTVFGTLFARRTF